MIIRACAFTNQGKYLLNTLSNKMGNHLWEVRESENLDQWIEESFYYHTPIVFVGALGIAVRKIAAYVNDKLWDSPVVVLDEEGRNVIPVIAGHVGGANKLAKEIADALSSNLVTTTATDVQNTFAIDVFAKNNGLKICNRDAIKNVSSKILNEGHISMAIHPHIEYSLDAVPLDIMIVPYEKKNQSDVIVDISEYESNALLLVVKPYVLGLGCKKDSSFEHLLDVVQYILKDVTLDLSDMASMASIDLKKKERGLLLMESFYRIPFYTYTADELKSIDGDFSSSDFVESVTGVSNVCERAAMKRAGEEGTLILSKVGCEGVTVAVSKRKERIETWEM